MKRCSKIWLGVVALAIAVGLFFMVRNFLFIRTTYYPDGTVKSRRWEPIGLGTYKDYSGFVNEYWPNGKPKFVGNYEGSPVNRSI